MTDFQLLRTFLGTRAAALCHRVARAVRRRAHFMKRRLRPPVCQHVTQEQWPVDMPLVSVVIPCYNYGRYLHGALESVVAQTFQRFEIIVINDGSTDELTKNVLSNLTYPKTRVVHQSNQGLANTRNFGAALAAGKYICYLDPDDMIEPTYLEKALAVLEADASLGCCYSWVLCFGELNSIWKTEALDPFTLWERTTASSHAVIRKAAWEAVRRFNGAGFLSKYDGYCEDWVFWIDMVCCGFRGHVIKEPLIRYRVHRDSLLQTHRSGYQHILEVLRADRKEFFSSPEYRRQLEDQLNRRLYVENPRLNLDVAINYIPDGGVVRSA